MRKVFPHLTPLFSLQCGWQLIEAMDHVLSMMDRKISDMTEKQFASSNIELLANTFVKGVGQKVRTHAHTYIYACGL